ncbi:MAG: hypothetical protein CMK32_14220, partial [Porticoccaceae bacterium]|nr:hypothetical protein [Porticoccaceae bacterium]
MLDGDMVAALTIARSLARRGVRVDLASHLAGVTASYSRAVTGFYCYPDPLSREDAFLDWLEKHLSFNQYDLVIPVTERTLVPISQHRAQLSGSTIAMAASDSLEVVLDKARTIALADELDIPVPVSITINGPGELKGVDGRFQYPVVIKPARSVGRSGHGRAQLKVEYAFTGEQLDARVRHALHFGPVILQEYVKGDGVGVEILAREGDILYAFQHQRLHEVPLTGGGSSLRKSVAVEPALLDAT